MKKSFLIFAMVFLAVISAYASGGGGGAVSVPRPGAVDAFAITKNVKATLTAIDPESRQISFRDDKRRELTFSFDKKVKVKAEEPKSFNGRKELRLDDLESGLNVKITYRESDKVITEIKVLKK